MFAIQVNGSTFDDRILILVDPEDGTPLQSVYVSNRVVDYIGTPEEHLLGTDRPIYSDETATVMWDQPMRTTIREQWESGEVYSERCAVLVDER